MNNKKYIALALCASLGLPLGASAFDMAKMGESMSVSAGYDVWAVRSSDKTLQAVGKTILQQGENIETVSMGRTELYFIRSDGALYTCGATGATAPKKLADGVQAVSAGTSHVALIKNDRSLWAMGANDRGQLGNGSRVKADKPVKVMDNVIAVSAGGRYTLALKTDGTLWAFGANTYGQLGDGTLALRERPVKIMDDVVSFSAGYGHSLAITTDGTLYAFGSNEFGQLGNGSTTNESKPVKIMENVQSVSAGYQHSALVTKEGVLYTFGDNFSGQLGAAESSRLKPMQVMSGVESVSAGRSNTLVTLKTGLLYKMGDGQSDAVFAGYNVRNGSLPMEAVPTAAKLDIDGYTMDVDAYNIGGSTYMKIRDISMFLILSGKQFSVEYDREKSAILLARKQPYVSDGTELGKGNGLAAMAYPSGDKLVLDGNEVAVSMYKIGDSNYVKLRDMGKLLNFFVDWDAATSTVGIRSMKDYVDEK